MRRFLVLDKALCIELNKYYKVYRNVTYGIFGKAYKIEIISKR